MKAGEEEGVDSEGYGGEGLEAGIGWRGWEEGGLEIGNGGGEEGVVVGDVEG